MVETPASALSIEGICDAGIDFVSFGTNDLTQYTLAVDRNNGHVADRFDELHPAVLELMRQVIGTCREHGVATSICGQAASKPQMVQFLVDEGVSSISAEHRRRPRRATRGQARRTATPPRLGPLSPRPRDEPARCSALFASVAVWHPTRHRRQESQLRCVVHPLRHPRAGGRFGGCQRRETVLMAGTCDAGGDAAPTPPRHADACETPPRDGPELHRPAYRGNPGFGAYITLSHDREHVHSELDAVLDGYQFEALTEHMTVADFSQRFMELLPVPEPLFDARRSDTEIDGPTRSHRSERPPKRRSNVACRHQRPRSDAAETLTSSTR